MSLPFSNPTVPCDATGVKATVTVAGPPTPVGGCVPCATAPIVEGRPEGYVQVCYDDGTTAILVIDRGEVQNAACPPVPASDPSIVGWIDNSNVYHAGAPAAGWHVCSASTKDVEIAGRVCVVDKLTGDFVASLFLMQTWDTSVDPPLYVGFEYEAVLADGSMVRPYTVPVTAQLEPCPSGTEEPVVMHEDVNGNCVSFIRWFSSVSKLPIADRMLDGGPYVVTDPSRVGFGDCPSGVYVEEACVKTVLPSVIPNTYDIFIIDLDNTWVHYIFNSVTGLTYPGGGSSSGANPNPVPTTDVAGIQSLLDAAFGPGQIGYTAHVNSHRGYFYALTPSFVNDFQDLIWWGSQSNYVNKSSLDGGISDVPGPGGISFRTVEAIKTISASGISVLLYEKDGSLIDPQPAEGEWSLGSCKFSVDSREVCTPTGEAWQVFGRDPVTGDISWVRLEDVNGNLVVGPVVDCGCGNIPLVEADFYSGTGVVVGSGFGSKYLDAYPVKWSVKVYQENSLVYSSPISPILTSPVDAQRWFNENVGKYARISSFVDVHFNGSSNKMYVPTSDFGRALIVIEETTAGTNGYVSQLWHGFTNYDVYGSTLDFSIRSDGFSYTPIDPTTINSVGWQSV